MAQDLFESLKDLETNEDTITFSQSNCPKRRTPLLTALECETKNIDHPYLEVEQTVVSFIDPERAAAFIQFAWQEFGTRRIVFYNWLSKIVDIASAEGRLRIGFSLGTLAQKNYLDIFEQILKNWLVSDKKAQRLTADIALSVAAFEPKVVTALSKNIISWAKSERGQQVKASIRLACGFSGTRIPDLTIEGSL